MKRYLQWLLLWVPLVVHAQRDSEFAVTNALRPGDIVSVVSAATGSNVNYVITASNLTLQVVGALRAGTGFTLTTNASNQTVTLNGTVDAALSNALVAQINTASNANASRTTVASNALQTWITLNSNNVDSVSNAFRTADTTISNLVNTGDTAISNRLTTITTGLTALTNNKLNATSGVHSGRLDLSNAVATAALRLASNATTQTSWDFTVGDLGLGTPWGSSLSVLNAEGTAYGTLSSNGWWRAQSIVMDSTNSLKWVNMATNTSATAGGNTLPANPLGFVPVQINGIWVKIPYYAQ